MGLTNAEVGNAARAGRDAVSATGNFSTDHYRLGFPRSYAPYVGYLPRRLQDILHERFRAGAIDQVVYSYSTPIAWRDNGVWIKPAVKYSQTTSSKHSPHIAGRSIPYDAGIEEYMSVLEGRIEYNRYQGVYGTYRVLQTA